MELENKIIKFRPLRRVKKTGKIAVASYMSWNKVRTADYNKFELLIDTEYQEFDKKEFVYDHEGKQLFYFTDQWIGHGVDCCDTPTFSHYTADYVAKHYEDMNELEPLTVETVVKWYGKFLLSLGKAVVKVKQ